MSARNEAELLKESLAGNRSAMDELAREYTPRLRKFIALMGVDDVDDVVQESLTQALGSLPSFRGQSKFSSWMLSVALNRCRRWHRSRHSKLVTSPETKLDRIDPNNPRRSVLSSLIEKESAGRITLALDRLPPAFREAFVLKHVEGLDYKEIAEIAGTTESTARVRSHRAKLLLQTDLGEVFATFAGLTSSG